jgi:hypothetical protein
MAVVMVSDAAGYPVRHEYRMRLYGCLLWYRGKDWAEQNVRDDEAEGYRRMGYRYSLRSDGSWSAVLVQARHEQLSAGLHLSHD